MPKDLLQNILNQGRIGKIKNGTAFFEEKKVDATLRLVKIKNIPENAVVISCDGMDSQSFFNKGNGQNMRCDYLLITPEALHFIELKSDKNASNENARTTLKEDCIKKFKAVSCILSYIDSVSGVFYEQQLQLNNKSKRYILFFHSPPLNKTTTSLKLKEKELYDTPETFLKWGVENEAEIDFKQL